MQISAVHLSCSYAWLIGQNMQNLCVDHLLFFYAFVLILTSDQLSENSTMQLWKVFYADIGWTSILLCFCAFTVNWFTVNLSCSVLICLIYCSLIFGTFTEHWFTEHLFCSVLICLINWAKHAKPFCTVSSNYVLEWKRERPWTKSCSLGEVAINWGMKMTMASMHL